MSDVYREISSIVVIEGGELVVVLDHCRHQVKVKRTFMRNKGGILRCPVCSSPPPAPKKTGGNDAA